MKLTCSAERDVLEIGILGGVVVLFSVLGSVIYGVLAMYVIELPFPFRQYQPKLEKAYRARHAEMVQNNEARLGCE